VIARLVLASLRRRFRQLALIFVAVGVAAATVATLAGFSARAGDRLAANLAEFGPNLTVRPQVGGPATLTGDAVARVRALPGVLSAVGVTAGAAGRRDGGSGFSRIEVRAEPRRLAEVARRIEGAVEGVEAKPLLKTAQSDARLTRRLQLLLAAVSAVSFLLALLSVGAATTALVGERRTEIGLMLALGYTGRRISMLLGAELLTAALAGALAGALVGELAAGDLASRLAGGAGGGLTWTWSGFAAAAAVAVLVVGTAMTLALNHLEQLDAARILRGD
jgi:ABC-type lipoprotein release transport system permease subunit